MKFAGKILFLVGISCFLMMYSGCKPKHPDEEPITDKQLALLTKGPWTVTAATRDGIDVKSDYTTFALTMTGTKGQTTFNFSTSGRPSLSAWPAQGTFTFDATAPATTLSRGDATPITVTYSVSSGSPSTLTMSFQYSGSGFSNRVGVVTGLWNFSFTTP